VKRGVFVKLMAAFLVVIAAAMVTMDLTTRLVWERSLHAEIERGLAERARSFANRVQTDKSASLSELVRQEAAGGETRVTVIDRDGKVLADSQADTGAMENHSTRPEFVAALHGRVGSAERLSSTVGIPFLYMAAPVPNGAVRMAYPLSNLRQTTARARRSLLAGSAIALLTALVIAAIFARLVERRMRRVVAFAERIASGDLSARIAESSSDELSIVATSLDRTARKLEESFSNMEASRQLLETLLNSMQEAVIAVGGDGRALWVNGRMQRLMGASVRLGAPVVETGRDPEFLGAIHGALTRREVTITRATSLLAGRIFQVTAAPMMPAGAVAVLHDLSGIERLEKTRRDFIANVSHELRTPLTSVQGYAETLLDSPVAHEPATREFLEIILKNAARMSRLTEDLLVLARVESGEQRFDRRAVSPAALLEEAVESLAVRAGETSVELVIESSVTDPVLADPQAIHQVLSNLLGNAMTYAREGKKVALGAQKVEGGVEFFVRDFGPGIPSEHLPRIFERFYRVDKARSRDSGGTGLGLAIVKHIVLAHGGEVRAESHLGRGSTFYFVLPGIGTASAESSPAGAAARS
jgi:two-component system phosphate regulon sensor histidine kinase PhoR